jgi:hypothetical protein
MPCIFSCVVKTFEQVEIETEGGGGPGGVFKNVGNHCMWAYLCGTNGRLATVVSGLANIKCLIKFLCVDFKLFNINCVKGFKEKKAHNAKCLKKGGGGGGVQLS